MWSKTATFVFLSLITSHAVAVSPTIERAEKLSVLLIRQHILKDNVMVWKGVEYDVSANYSLCDAYQGICYRAKEAGFNEPVILAVYEIGPDQLDIMAIDYLKYKKDLSVDAIKYYGAKDGKTETQIFAMQSEEGERMFDALGQLTKHGERQFNAAIFADAGVAPLKPASAVPGKTAAKTAAKKPAKKGKAAKEKGKANSAFSRYSVKQLGYMGYKEIYKPELDCLHEIPFDDKELIMEKVQDGSKVRWFLHPNDPAIMVAMKFRKEKVCEPFGSPSR